MRNTESHPPTKLRVLRDAVGILLAALAAGTISVSIITSIATRIGLPASDPVATYLLPGIAVQGLAFLAIAAVYLQYTETTIQDIGVTSITPRLLLRILFWGTLSTAAYLTLQFALTTIGTPIANNQIATGLDDIPWMALLLAIHSIIIIGPGEELLFRGLIQSHLRQAYTAQTAIVLTSLAFTSIHLPALLGSGKIIYLTVVFVFSILFGALYEKHNNLTLVMGVHGVYNATQFVLLYAALST